MTGVQVELTHLFSLAKLDDKHTFLGADLAFIDNNTHTHNTWVPETYIDQRNLAHIFLHMRPLIRHNIHNNLRAWLYDRKFY